MIHPTFPSSDATERNDAPARSNSVTDVIVLEGRVNCPPNIMKLSIKNGGHYGPRAITEVTNYDIYCCFCQHAAPDCEDLQLA